MSRSLNKVQLIGNLGKDPEVRFTQDGRAIANFTVATSDSWRDAQGATQERTEWHRVVIFGKLAEIAQQYLKKGSKVYIEGKLQTRKWTDQSGQERYTTEIEISQFYGAMLMLDSKGAGGGGGPGSYDAPGGYAAPAARPPVAAASSRPAANQPPVQDRPPVDDYRNLPDFEDDIPF